MAADLHIHTTFSDGTETPEEVVVKAKEVQLSTIAITDHDVCEGVAPAMEQGKKIGVKVIPGVEFTTERPDTEVHILGFFIDYERAQIKKTLEIIREDRRSRIYKIVEKLKKKNVVIDPEKVFNLASSGSVGRPHVARALIEAGIVKNMREAFDKYLAWEGPAYVPHYRLSPAQAIALIRDSGGVPVYAHPAVSDCDDIIPELISHGLMGIEAFYPGYTEDDIKRYRSIALKHGLLVTGGSDYHGTKNPRGVKLGDVSVPDELVEDLFEAWEKNK